MRTAIGFNEGPEQWPQGRCQFCGSSRLVPGVWHHETFEYVPPDTDVHDPYCEAVWAKRCLECKRVEVTADVVGPLTTTQA